MVTQLSLGELRCAACGFETVLLSFLHTRVAREEACLLEGGLVALVSGYERTSEAVADCACLTRKAAAANGSNDIKLTDGFGYAEGLVDDELEGLKTKVIVNVSAIYGDVTRAGVHTNASDRLLSSSGAVEIGLCTSIHILSLPFFSLTLQQQAAVLRGCGSHLRKHADG